MANRSRDQLEGFFPPVTRHISPLRDSSHIISHTHAHSPSHDDNQATWSAIASPSGTAHIRSPSPPHEEEQVYTLSLDDGRESRSGHREDEEDEEQRDPTRGELRTIGEAEEDEGEGEGYDTPRSPAVVGGDAGASAGGGATRCVA